MADKNRKEAKVPEGAAPATKRPPKKGIALGGGIVGLIALAYAAFLMAVPGGVETRTLNGPYVAEILPSEISLNLSGNDGRNYLALRLSAEYAAYDEEYMRGRAADPLYHVRLEDRLLVVVSGKTKGDVQDAAGKDALRAEIAASLDPILFPVHVGSTSLPTSSDSQSGLRPGRSMDSGPWRGLWHEHVLRVDAQKRTIALDDGPAVSFQGGERDLRLQDPAGDALFVDVSGLRPGFAGEVPIGVQGRIRAIYYSKFIIQ